MGPDMLKNCVFPFKVGNATYNSCTNDHDKNQKFWCSTEVDENGDSFKTRWGYCDPACETIPDKTGKIFKLTKHLRHIYS